MELRHLRYFVAVAEHLHFARAAESLHLTQPALSHQIKALEDDLGVRLFERTKREVTLTQAGAYFLAEAQATLTQAQRAQAVAQRVARGQLGKVRLGYVPSVPFSGLLPQLGSAFGQQAPELQLVLEETLTGPEQLIKIAGGKLDAGLLRLPLEQPLPHLETKVLIKERMVIALREDHPLAGRKQLSVTDLRKERFIVWQGVQPMTMYDHLLALAQAGGFALRVAQAAPSLAAMVALVAGGAGIAYVPESLRNMKVPSVCFRPLRDLARVSELAVCYRSDETSLAVWKFLKMLNAFAPKAPDPGQLEPQESGARKARKPGSRAS